MDIGNIVMFIGEGRYAKYFFGQLAEIISSSISKSSGKEHVRVKWQLPVRYFDSYATISDFEANNFIIVSEK